MIVCPKCDRVCKSNKSLSSHMWKSHTLAGQNHTPMKGRVHSCKTKASISCTNQGHKRMTDDQKKNLSLRMQTNNPSFDSQVRKRISESMKVAHAEGRAHNIGECRWNNSPSYPEQFFMKVIENEFNDKNYEREVPLGRYSLDFFWRHKSAVIEIDGEQHERFVEQQERDRAKDELVLASGMRLLRIKWKDMFNDTKTYIAIAKEFIDRN